MDAKAIIIDLRCYPGFFPLFELGAYLLPQSKPFCKVSSTSIAHPGRFVLSQELAVGKNNPDYFKGQVFILVNEITQSSAEFHAMAWRQAPNALVVGSQTAGADGNVSYIVLPGNMTTQFSGLGIYYPDGSETQRIGIVPDVEVKPTCAGIQAGRDEVLEKALSLVK
jgi:C-terminal processing protease CtpA/Prc